MEYPSVAHLGARANELFAHSIQWWIEEKIDGSQLSFSLRPQTEPPELRFTNHGKELLAAVYSNNVFGPASARLSAHALSGDGGGFHAAFVYHGEAVCKRKHSTLEYQRTPRFFFVCYDIYDSLMETYLSYPDKLVECRRLGLECVQLLREPNADPTALAYDTAAAFVERIDRGELTSMLGGCRLEGVVIKHNNLVTIKTYQGVERSRTTAATRLKLVTKPFKESHASGGTPKMVDVADANAAVADIGRLFATEARFTKGLLRMRDADSGINDGYPRQTLEVLERDLDRDLAKEYEDEVKTYLWHALGGLVKKAAREGLADFWTSHRAE